MSPPPKKRIIYFKYVKQEESKLLKEVVVSIFWLSKLQKLT